MLECWCILELNRLCVGFLGCCNVFMENGVWGGGIEYYIFEGVVMGNERIWGKKFWMIGF